MTTQELKQQIDKVLGNSIRCLLPSYWWKRLFNQVADRIDEVEQSTSQLIDSKVEEVKMPIVESVDELEKLKLAKGSVAAVEKTGESATVKISDCYLSYNLEEDWDKYTIVKGVEEKDVIIDKDVAAVVMFSASKEDIDKDALQVSVVSGIFYYIKLADGEARVTSLEHVNKALSSGKYRAIFSFYDHDDCFIDDYFTFYLEKPQPSLYIKGDSWERLAKEYVVSSEEELNALNVENGTIARVASGDRIVGSFNSLAVGDRVDDVEFMQPPYAFGSCSVMFKDKDGNAIAFGVDSNGTECQFGLVTRDVGTIIFGNENGIDQDLYNQAITIFKERECTFEWVEGKLPVDSFVRPVTNTPIVSDAYIKGETWTRLLKEGDVVGGGVYRELYATGDSFANVEGELTEEQKEYNKETLELLNGNIQIIYKVHNLTLNCLNYQTHDNAVVFCFEYIDVYQITIQVNNDGSAECVASTNVLIDDKLSDTSTNAVQNKVITAALNEKASIAYVDEKVANISSEEGLEYRKLYAKGDTLGIVTGELTSEQKAYNIETINLYWQNKAIIGYEQVIGEINRISLCKGTDSNGESINFYFDHVLNASVLISITISADGSGTYYSDTGLLIDSVVLDSSTNPVQNKAIKTYVDNAITEAITNTINTPV